MTRLSPQCSENDDADFVAQPSALFHRPCSPSFTHHTLTSSPYTDHTSLSSCRTANTTISASSFLLALKGALSDSDDDESVVGSPVPLALRSKKPSSCLLPQSPSNKNIAPVAGKQLCRPGNRSFSFIRDTNDFDAYLGDDEGNESSEAEEDDKFISE